MAPREVPSRSKDDSRYLQPDEIAYIRANWNKAVRMPQFWSILFLSLGWGLVWGMILGRQGCPCQPIFEGWPQVLTPSVVIVAAVLTYFIIHEGESLDKEFRGITYELERYSEAKLEKLSSFQLKQLLRVMLGYEESAALPREKRELVALCWRAGIRPSIYVSNHDSENIPYTAQWLLYGVILSVILVLWMDVG